MAASPPSGSRPPAQLNANDQFFRYFQGQVAGLQVQFSRLEAGATVSGEHADIVDQCLANIARLSNDVKDASSYLPAYDQRTYGDAIKALSTKLQDVRATHAPKPKFSFKKGPAFTAQKNESAISLNDTTDVAHVRRAGAATNQSSLATTPVSNTSEDDAKAGSREPLQPARSRSDSQSKAINLSDHNDKHIYLPVSSDQQTPRSATISDISRSVVDMSCAQLPRRPAQSLATLTLRNIRSSLIVCGHVGGAAHLTNVTDSIIVVASRQFRMHASKNCDVYLRTSSRPIIEDCTGIRFAPLPETYANEADGESENQWDQVDDFKWLKKEPSPNWRVLNVCDRVEDNVWSEVVPGKPGSVAEDILRDVGLDVQDVPREVESEKEY